MTSSTKRGVWSASGFVLPADLAVDGHRLMWTDVRPGDDWTGSLDTVVADFLRLATADADDMADFARRYGVPELCGEHGRPDRHHRGREFCPFGTTGTSLYVSADAIRDASRSFGAAKRLGVALSARHPGDKADWMDLQGRVGGMVMWSADDWRHNRRALAEWATRILADCGVAPLVRWDRPRMTITSEAHGLLGVIAVVLVREIGQGEQWTCDVCGEPVERVRPPGEGEGVYCKQPACRREQQRRNQAAWRARKRAGTKGGSGR